MDLKLTSTHDLDTSGSRLRLVDGVEHLAQKIKVRLLFYKGEFYGDRRIGTPWFQQLLEKGVSQVLLRSTLQKVVLRTPGIAQVPSMSVAYDGPTRQATVSFTAITTSGQTINFDEVFVI